MLRVDMSHSVQRLLPFLSAWLEHACYTVAVIDPAKPRERGDVRILLGDEIQYATYRDILVDRTDAATRLVRAANGMPARIGFASDSDRMACALVAECLRPDDMPAIGDARSANLIRLAARIAQSDATALIQGDTGTGKEGIARFLHINSPRADRNFVAVNCAALPETMMEAMLFGHRKGAFTGAQAASEGLFMAADGGTLFLDEIAELPLTLQAKLLRALQEGEVLPVGATQPVPVNVRIIAACNRDLAAEADAGRFRSDLYWRLNVMPLTLAPLSTRRDDILAITAAFLKRFQADGRGPFAVPTPAAVERLLAHSWPGNARELGNVLQRALVLREADDITPADLMIMPTTPVQPFIEPSTAPQPFRASKPEPAGLRDVARRSALEAIRAALRDTDGHRARAARQLGISERTLRYRLAEMRELATA